MSGRLLFGPLSLLGVAFVLVCTLPAAEGQPFTLDYERLDWRETPAVWRSVVPEETRIVSLGRLGASLLRWPAGWGTSWRAREGDVAGAVLSGVLRVEWEGVAEAKNCVLGNWFRLPGGSAHRMECVGTEDCVLYLYGAHPDNPLFERQAPAQGAGQSRELESVFVDVGKADWEPGTSMATQEAAWMTTGFGGGFVRAYRWSAGEEMRLDQFRGPIGGDAAIVISGIVDLAWPTTNTQLGAGSYLRVPRDSGYRGRCEVADCVLLAVW